MVVGVLIAVVVLCVMVVMIYQRTVGSRKRKQENGVLYDNANDDVTEGETTKLTIVAPDADANEVEGGEPAAAAADKPPS